MTVIQFIMSFITCQMSLVGIHDDDKITNFMEWNVIGLMLATGNRSCFNSNASHGLSGRIDDIPFLIDIFRFYVDRFHFFRLESVSKDSNRQILWLNTEKDMNPVIESLSYGYWKETQGGLVAVYNHRIGDFRQYRLLRIRKTRKPEAISM